MEFLQETFQRMYGYDIRDICTTINPAYPLHFECFGDAVADKEFTNHIARLDIDLPIVNEPEGDWTFYCSPGIEKAESAARQAYVAENPIKAATNALKISPYCPEAYNVLAKFSDSYGTALEFYNKAVEVAPNLSRKFDEEIRSGSCWSLNHLHSYFRAVHGQANTLRKLGRCNEALQKYMQLFKLDPESYSTSSFANWRFHVLETYMKAGNDEGARRFALKKINKCGFAMGSSQGAWFWNFALLDYRMGNRDAFKTLFESDTKAESLIYASTVGAIIRAVQIAPLIYRFMTGECKLPNCRIPDLMGNEASFSNTATYWKSNKELWENTPGAIEWACTTARTSYCLAIIQKDTKACERFKIEPNLEVFKDCVDKGIFLEATVQFGQRILHEAIRANNLDQVKCLLAGGSNPTPKLATGVPQPLQLACYYEYNLDIIRILCTSGADPTKKYGMHYNALQMAAEQGSSENLEVAIRCLPTEKRNDKDVMDPIIEAIFGSPCYLCVAGKRKGCHRCLHDRPHPEDVSFTGCLDVIFSTGYTPTKPYIWDTFEIEEHHVELYAYLLDKVRIKLESNKMENSKASSFKEKAKSKRSCQLCKASGMKLKFCSRCRAVKYCSIKCQKKDWNEHKLDCFPGESSGGKKI